MRLSALYLLLCSLTCCAFDIEFWQWELSAPNNLCISGSLSDGEFLACPVSKEEIDAFDAIVMDEHGYVDVSIKGLYFTTSRRLENGHIDDQKKNEKIESKILDGSPDGDTENTKSSDEKTTTNQSDNYHQESQVEASTKLNWASPSNFHVQVYLVSLDNIRSSSSSQSKHEDTFYRGSDVISHTDFISGKGLCCYEYGQMMKTNGKEQPADISQLVEQCSPMDLRPLVPRVGSQQKLSAPLPITTSSGKQQIELSARFRPVRRGRYMVVISNCAVIMNDDGNITPLIAHFDNIKIKFASKFGELPMSMSGIVPFYGVLLVLYGILGLIWFRRSKGIIICPNGRDVQCKRDSYASNRGQARPLLGLQRAIYSLVLLQIVFTFVAFAYYVHLNISVVDIHILYGGTMAALAGITPFSILVGMVHFVTFLACQAVVVLATDGTWLIQSSIRPDTKKALIALGIAWACFFVTNTLLSRRTRLIIISSLGSTWVAFLIFNVRRSLRHLRSLILGQSNETVVAVGGNLVAKRSMYRKFFAVLAIYPIVFSGGVIWNVASQEDSWAWVGYVLVDVYVFIILLHASITWLPRPLAAMEYAKYIPLDQAKTSSSIHDPTVWEEEINYSFDELELS